MALGLLLIRVIVGGIMAAHGAQKLFGSFGGHGLDGTAGWLGSMGFRPQRFHALITAVSEFAGGLLLVVGLLTPFAAAAVIGVMIVAIATVHGPKGFFNMEGGYEFNLLLAVAAAGIAFTGAGRISLDHGLGLALRGVTWGLAAVALACVGAALTLFSRQQTLAETPAAAPIVTDEAEDTEVIVVDLAKERPTVDTY
jgi:putative oxidoreductase